VSPRRGAFPGLAFASFVQRGTIPLLSLSLSPPLTALLRLVAAPRGCRQGKQKRETVKRAEKGADALPNAVSGAAPPAALPLRPDTA